MLFLDVREEFDPRAVHEHRVAWHKLCDDTASSVHCGHESYRRACDGVPSFALTHAKKDSIEQPRAPTQEPSKQRVSQIGADLGGVTTSEKLILTKSYVALELIVCWSADHSQSRRGAEISWSSRQKLRNTVAGLCLVSSNLLLSAFSLSVLGHVHLQSSVILRVDAHSVNGSRSRSSPELSSIHKSDDRVIHAW